MTAFQAIDDDVLYQLLPMLDCSCVAALGQTCRRFTNLCRDHLWHSIDLDISSERAKLLIRTLEQREEYGRLIKNLKLRGVILPDGLQKRADIILRALSNVMELHLERPWRRWDTFIGPARTPLNYLAWQSRPQYDRPEHLLRMLEPLSRTAKAPVIRKIELVGDFTSSEIFDAMTLPGLQSLIVTDLISLDTLPQMHIGTRAAQSIRQLRLRGSEEYDVDKRTLRSIEWALQPETLFHITSRLPRLEVFETWLPYDSAQPLLATALTTALLPLESHLQSLVIADPFLLDWSHGVYGQLSLRTFEKLEYLEAMSICWFATSGPGPDRLALAELLPSSLLEIKILFTLESGAIFTPEEAKLISHSEFYVASSESWRWRWIKAIVSAKGTTLPRLRHIALEEERSRSRPRKKNWYYEILRWTPTESLNEAMTAAEITFEAHLRFQTTLRPF